MWFLVVCFIATAIHLVAIKGWLDHFDFDE